MSRWTYSQAWICLVGSTAATLCVSAGGYWLWSRWHQQRLTDARNQIVAIVQTGPEREALATSHLAELLDLSVDRPTSLYAFDVSQAERRLESCPLIASAKIRRIPPGMLYVDYTIRRPLALLADYQNIGIDREGYFFPIAPFYPPKNLPEIYLGLPPFDSLSREWGWPEGSWRIPLEYKYLRVAFEVLQLLCDAPWREGMRLKRIDVSNAFALSPGQREIILFVEEEWTLHEGEKEIVCVFPKIIRLPQRECVQQLSNFLSLRATMMEDYKRQLAQAHYDHSPIWFAARIIDLRVPQVAFVQNN